ncbi:MAG: hypothetical protein WC471_01660 [Candidatus Woesearchaeota archaeon]
MVKKTLKLLLSKLNQSRFVHKLKHFKYWRLVFAAFAIFILFGGYFGYSYLKQKQFTDDYNAMNSKYKEALYATGSAPKTSLAKVSAYNDAFTIFFNKYRDNPPKDFAKDMSFSGDMEAIALLSENALFYTQESEYSLAHAELESIRQVWQLLFKRNDVGMMSYYMTDFHDAMESVISLADIKDAAGVSELCPSLTEKWAAIKNMEVSFSVDKLIDFKNQVSAEEINVRNLCSAAESKNIEKLPYLAAKMKSGFISAYLRYG